MEKIETFFVRDPAYDRASAYVERRSALPWLCVVAAVGLAIIAAFAFGLIDINQTREGVHPDAKVQSSGGTMPAFDVDTAKVNVETETESVNVPHVEIGSTIKDVEVPSVSVDRAGTAPRG